MVAFVIYKVLKHVYRFGFALIHSSLSQAERFTIIDTLLQGNSGDATIDIVVGTYRLLGTSFTIIKARIAVLFELDFIPANELQARFRHHRIGQRCLTRCIRLLQLDSTDVRLEKCQIFRQIFDDNVQSDRNFIKDGDEDKKKEEKGKGDDLTVLDGDPDWEDDVQFDVKPMEYTSDDEKAAMNPRHERRVILDADGDPVEEDSYDPDDDVFRYANSEINLHPEPGLYPDLSTDHWRRDENGIQ